MNIPAHGCLEKNLFLFVFFFFGKKEYHLTIFQFIIVIEVSTNMYDQNISEEIMK